MKTPALLLGLVGMLSLSTTPGAMAQDGDLPARVPQEGLAILDCAPAAPAPENSCVVRVPSGQKLGELSSDDLSEQEASFKVVRSEGKLPAGVDLSSTLVLIDLSRGPNNGRLRSWTQERNAIAEMIAALPRDGALAIYGFGADLIEISGFSQRRSAALDAVGDLDLTENNTILTSNMSAAISVLAEQERSLFKNLIVISDGDEEGVGDVEKINGEAAEAGVTLSALGMFWRGEGNPATSRGIDVMGRITAQQQGLKRSVFLGDQSRSIADAKDFASAFSSSIGRSGLILPRGEPAPARITIEMRGPEPGQAGRSRTVEYQVKFTPAAGEAAPVEEPEAAPKEGLLFGYPANYVYIGAGVLAFLLLLLVVLMARRGGDDDVGHALQDDGEPMDDIHTDLEPVTPRRDSRPAPAPQPAAVAFLQRLDTGERLGIHGSRISIGRAANNGIIVTDHGVSRIHAELFRNREGGFSISDMDSLNGTFVNEQKVAGSVPLKIGDTIGLGKTVNVKLVLP